MVIATGEFIMDFPLNLTIKQFNDDFSVLNRLFFMTDEKAILMRQAIIWMAPSIDGIKIFTDETQN
ncbi:hypothetical protein KUH03_28115 [Sphingobacterium sp. E70]|uniref:hypothetical protein n=1 Tax=Sphingobacterium sp. E70 TaxID=2853439 RepID=UPI00211BEC30|nr:hypothetical protein [Sphingobacterium sp. E70]ULT23079.1 hypothetical protein KUH03_28115 [Sphingobacterium sp. E70]